MEPPSLLETQPPPTGSDKIWSILSHLSFFVGAGIILPLVVYLAMKKESAYVATNAKEALNFHISLIIYAVCCIPLMVILIGVPLMMIIGIAGLILAIKASCAASDGGCYRYPLTLRFVK